MEPAAATEGKYRQILGVSFFIGTPTEAAAIGMGGGLVVVPAAPALVEMPHDKAYREALQHADLAITDSGLMVLLWRLIAHERLERVSGLEYIKLILAEPAVRQPQATFWVMPEQSAMDRNLEWLGRNGHPTTREDCYLAPHYGAGDFGDPALLSLLNTRRPPHIIIAIGGGTQERLGYYLKRRLDYHPAIHCIGAAVGFLSGTQVHIPTWADYLYLGWLFRCLHAPGRFIPRYWKARKLVAMMLKYRNREPV